MRTRLQRLTSFVPRSSAALHGWLEEAYAKDAFFGIAAAMTIVLLLLHMDAIWYMQACIVLFGIAAILNRNLVYKENFWFALTFFIALANYSDWYYLDNHKYLIFYWILALSLARMVKDPGPTLRLSARLLIGCCFLFAILWKILSPDFLSGTFFHFTFLTDGRFREVTDVLGGATGEALRQNTQALNDFAAFGDPATGFQLSSGPRIPMMAQALTWWTVGIESLVAVLFLWLPDNRVSRWRDIPLLLFLYTTYLIAPVIGFAWVLATMGLIQSNPRTFRTIPLLYIGAPLLLEVLDWIPVQELLAGVYQLIF